MYVGDHGDVPGIYLGEKIRDTPCQQGPGRISRCARKNIIIRMIIKETWLQKLLVATCKFVDRQPHAWDGQVCYPILSFLWCKLGSNSEHNKNIYTRVHEPWINSVTYSFTEQSWWIKSVTENTIYISKYSAKGLNATHSPLPTSCRPSVSQLKWK